MVVAMTPQELSDLMDEYAPKIAAIYKELGEKGIEVTMYGHDFRCADRFINRGKYDCWFKYSSGRLELKKEYYLD